MIEIAYSAIISLATTILYVCICYPVCSPYYAACSMLSYLLFLLSKLQPCYPVCICYPVCSPYYAACSMLSSLLFLLSKLQPCYPTRFSATFLGINLSFINHRLTPNSRCNLQAAGVSLNIHSCLLYTVCYNVCSVLCVVSTIMSPG